MTTAPPRSSAPAGARSCCRSRRRARPRSAASRARARCRRRRIVTTQALPRITRASSGTSSNRSTSTRPRSVSLSDGITESARKARCWNGDSSSQPSVRAASVTAREPATTSSSGASESRPATGSAQLRHDICPVDDDDPAAAVREPPDGRGHRCVVHPDDDDVVCIVRDRRGERAALEPEAPDEAEPDPARAEVPLDDGDLREVSLRIRERFAGVRRDRLDERVRDDLAGDDPDHARLASRSTGCGTSPARRRRSGRCAAPSRAPSRAGSRRRAARLQHRLRNEALRDRAARAGRRGSRERRRRGATSPCQSDGLSVAQTSASSGGIPNATASRTIELMWPSSAMCSGSRSSVQNAMRDGPYSASSGSSACRLRAAEASRISSHSPARSRSRPFSARVGLVVRADAGGGVRVQRPSEDAGRVAVDVLGERELRELRRRTADHAGEVHHLGQPDHARGAGGAHRDRRAVSSRRGDSNCDAGTHDDAMK